MYRICCSRHGRAEGRELERERAMGEVRDGRLTQEGYAVESKLEGDGVVQRYPVNLLRDDTGGARPFA